MLADLTRQVEDHFAESSSSSSSDDGGESGLDWSLSTGHTSSRPSDMLPFDVRPAQPFRTSFASHVRQDLTLVV